MANLGANILFICTDDEDAFANPSYMPYLLANVTQKGVGFPYSAFDEFSLCSPSRATLLLGLMAHNHGVTTNSKDDGGWAGLMPYVQNPPYSIAQWMSVSGIHTCHSGKVTNNFAYWNYPDPNGPLQIPVGYERFMTILGDVCAFHATSSGTTLTVLSIIGGDLSANRDNFLSGPGIPTSGISIIAQVSGTPHGVGVYTTNAATFCSSGDVNLYNGYDETVYYNFRLAVDGVEQSYYNGEYTTNVFADFADDFIANVPPGEQWVCWLWPNSPHSPATPAAVYSGAFSGVPMPLRPNFNEAEATFQFKPGWLQFDPEFVSTVSGSILGDVLTVTTLVSGALILGSALDAGGIDAGTFPTAQITGDPGGVGTYRVSVAQTLALKRITQAQERHFINRNNQQDSWRRRRECLLSVDDTVQQLLTTIAARGDLDNTYIIYLSDNGKILGEHRLVGKDCPYEEGTRVPLSIRGPAIASGVSGIVRTELVGNLDICRTMCAMARITPQRVQDGASLFPLFTSGAVSGWRTAYMISCIPDTGFAVSGVRTNNWWLSQWESDSYGIEHELYNMQSDVYQLVERYGVPAYAPAVSALTTALDALRFCSGASCFYTGPIPKAPKQHVAVRTGTPAGFKVHDIQPDRVNNEPS